LGRATTQAKPEASSASLDIAPQIAVTPTVQMVIDPVRNTDEDVIWVLGLRSRFTFWPDPERAGQGNP
jgi:hypothetical protein